MVSSESTWAQTNNSKEETGSWANLGHWQRRGNAGQAGELKAVKKRALAHGRVGSARCKALVPGGYVLGDGIPRAELLSLKKHGSEFLTMSSNRASASLTEEI